MSDGAEVSCALIGDPVLSSSYILTYHNVISFIHNNYCTIAMSDKLLCLSCELSCFICFY